ncbi:MAG: Flp family type IVb pilin [Rhodospirillaceae bacterium]
MFNSMTSIYRAAKTAIKNESGATAIEYGLIAAAMATAIGAGMLLFGPAITAFFTRLATTLGAA